MKNLIYVAVLLLIVSSLSFGQASANVTVKVDAALTIFKINDLALGTVVRGNPVTVLSTDAAAASFIITGIEDHATTITVVPSPTLTNGTSTMPFIAAIPITNTKNDQVNGATPLTATTGGSATTNDVGNLWLWIGGGVNVGTSQQSGNYTGTIQVSVTQS